MLDSNTYKEKKCRKEGEHVPSQGKREKSFRGEARESKLKI